VAVLYRAVHRNPPNREDFLSAKEMGVRKPSKGKDLFWLGFSAFDTLERARTIALKYPHQGDYIAAFGVPDSSIVTSREDAFTLPAAGSITIIRSFGPGHWTVWGDSDLFPPLVLWVIPVDR
jgi:hypothetical protein